MKIKIIEMGMKVGGTVSLYLGGEELSDRDTRRYFGRAVEAAENDTWVIGQVLPSGGDIYVRSADIMFLTLGQIELQEVPKWIQEAI